MKCMHCGDRIKECHCGLGHGYIHTTLPRDEQLHRCWPNAHITGFLPGRDPAKGPDPRQGRQQTFAQPV